VPSPGGDRQRRGRHDSREEADNLFICVGVFIHWDAADDTKIQDYNYKATKESIARAVAGTPKASEVIAKAKSTAHPFAAHV
jgi:5,6,7,8-tetrahydromethanopterin hydro-lyase